jgi:hypothetical protein
MPPVAGHIVSTRPLWVAEMGLLSLWPRRPMVYYGPDPPRRAHTMAKLFLLVAGVFLIPVALSYGVDA